MSSIKPWMARRRGESISRWQARLNRTCYACGKPFPNMRLCDNHERETHQRQGKEST